MWEMPGWTTGSSLVRETCSERRTRADWGSGQTIGIELGDKHRSEVKTCHPDPYASLRIRTRSLGEKCFDLAQDRRANAFMKIIIRSYGNLYTWEVERGMLNIHKRYASLKCGERFHVKLWRYRSIRSSGTGWDRYVEVESAQHLRRVIIYRKTKLWISVVEPTNELQIRADPPSVLRFEVCRYSKTNEWNICLAEIF